MQGVVVPYWGKNSIIIFTTVNRRVVADVVFGGWPKLYSCLKIKTIITYSVEEQYRTWIMPILTTLIEP